MGVPTGVAMGVAMGVPAITVVIITGTISNAVEVHHGSLGLQYCGWVYTCARKA